MIDIDKLNNDFGIADQLHFVKGEGGFVMIEVDNDYATAVISTYSGQIMAYQPKTEAEPLLFLSDLAIYENGKAMRGGLPICWPWFAEDIKGKDLPTHGFVRDQQWQAVKSQKQDDGSTKVTLEISYNEYSLKLWPYKFKLQIEITIGSTLTVELITNNLDDKLFTISQALHSYLAIGDVNKIEVTGLDGLCYLDKTAEFTERDQRGDVAIDGLVDRIYQGVESDVLLNDPVFDRTIRISSQGSNTFVVWNPGEKAASTMIDLAGDGFKKFVCIEAANTANDKVTIAAGESHSLTVNYSIEH
jgi:glucose-6-phosphate 1-epimerase